jgi:hypothetical protein
MSVQLSSTSHTIQMPSTTSQAMPNDNKHTLRTVAKYVPLVWVGKDLLFTSAATIFAFAVDYPTIGYTALVAGVVSSIFSYCFAERMIPNMLLAEDLVDYKKSTEALLVEYRAEIERLQLNTASLKEGAGELKQIEREERKEQRQFEEDTAAVKPLAEEIIQSTVTLNSAANTLTEREKNLKKDEGDLKTNENQLGTLISSIGNADSALEKEVTDLSKENEREVAAGDQLQHQLSGVNHLIEAANNTVHEEAELLSHLSPEVDEGYIIYKKLSQLPGFWDCITAFQRQFLDAKKK